jgi:hypothetical protein
MVIDTKEILRLAKERWGNDAAIAEAAGLHRATIWRLKNGRHPKTYASTIGKIVLALNGGRP